MALTKQQSKLLNEQQTLQQLQKDLAKQNKIEYNLQPPLDEQDFGSKQILQKLRQRIHYEGKLISFFLKAVQYSTEKIQKEKVNIWTKKMELIEEKVKKKIEKNERKIVEFKIDIQNKYNQIQNLREQNCKKTKKVFRKTQNGAFGENYKIKISDLLQSINNSSHQVEKMNQQMMKIKQQWKGFLKYLLKNKFYRHDGIKWFIQQLANLGYSILSQDLPDVLDNQAKCFVINEYVPAKDKSIQQVKVIRKNYEKINYEVPLKVAQMPDKSLVKDLYAQTRMELAKLVGKRQWRLNKLTKVKERVVSLPKVQLKKQQNKEWEWQKRRMNNAYINEQSLRVAKTLIFGIN